MFKKLRYLFANLPFPIACQKILWKVFSIKLKDIKNWQSFVENKSGLEIGAPSPRMSDHGFMPLYSCMASLDAVNFSKQTTWEGKLKEGMFFRYGKRLGQQYILEATALLGIDDYSYDFVLSCNNLEHIANPLKAIFEWKRVLKDGGIMIMILPNKEVHFDRYRSETSFEHIKADYENDTSEGDITHLDEILQLHDLKRDPGAGSAAQFKERCINNIKYRCMHHHIFNQNTLKKMLEFAGMKIFLQYSSNVEHYIVASK